MATGPRYTVDLRRRRRGLTDYRQRLRLLKSGQPRLVARVSNRHVRAHLETVGPAGDLTVAAATSEELGEFGWRATTGNLPSAYLTGFLLGRRAVATGHDEAVLDIGLHSPTPGSKVFAIQEGAIDAGMEIPHNEAVLPAWSRNRGEHIAAYADQRDIDTADDEIDPRTIPEHFDEVREAIMEAEIA